MSLPVGRREFITLLGTAAAAWPLAARAQQLRRIGVLMNGAVTDQQLQSYFTTFVQALRQLGWVDGQNLRIEASLERCRRGACWGFRFGVGRACTRRNYGCLDHEPGGITAC